MFDSAPRELLRPIIKGGFAFAQPKIFARIIHAIASSVAFPSLIILRYGLGIRQLTVLRALIAFSIFGVINFFAALVLQQLLGDVLLPSGRTNGFGEIIFWAALNVVWIIVYLIARKQEVADVKRGQPTLSYHTGIPRWLPEQSWSIDVSNAIPALVGLNLWVFAHLPGIGSAMMVQSAALYIMTAVQRHATERLIWDLRDNIIMAKYQKALLDGSMVRNANPADIIFTAAQRTAKLTQVLANAEQEL